MRFRYRPSRDGNGWTEEDSWEVLANGTLVGTVQRQAGAPPAWLTNWVASSPHPTRRAASESALSEFLKGKG